MKSEIYGKVFKNGTRHQLCYAIVFDEFDTVNDRFEYTLRFNTTFPLNSDHPKTDSDSKVHY